MSGTGLCLSSLQICSITACRDPVDLPLDPCDCRGLHFYPLGPRSLPLNLFLQKWPFSKKGPRWPKKLRGACCCTLKEWPLLALIWFTIPPFWWRSAYSRPRRPWVFRGMWCPIFCSWPSCTESSVNWCSGVVCCPNGWSGQELGWSSSDEEATL